MAPGRRTAPTCAILLALALVCLPTLAQAQDGGSNTTVTPTPDPSPAEAVWDCTPLAFVLGGKWVAFMDRSRDNAYAILRQQPIASTHQISMVFGVGRTGAAAEAGSDPAAAALLNTYEYKTGSEVALMVGWPISGRSMSANLTADASMVASLADAYPNYAPLRFDLSVPWRIDSRRFEFTFSHPRCPHAQSIVYKYNPYTALDPIIPEEEGTTGAGQDSAQWCQLTAVSAASQWACEPAFARDVYKYNCTAHPNTFLERVTVRTDNSFLALKLSAAADPSTVRELVSGVESSSFPLLTGLNVIELSATRESVCTASYVFEVTRPQTPANESPAANWRADEFGACSGTCPNEGTQTRTVTCVTESGEAADESLCGGAATKPISSQSCYLSCGPTEGENTDGGNNNNGGGNGFADSAAHSSAAASPFALLGAAFVALLALRQ